MLHVEAEGPVVKSFDIIYLQRTVPFSQCPQNVGSAFEMVEHLSLAVMVDIASILFGPDALCQEPVLRLLEAAGNDHAGSGQGGEPERNLARQSVERCEGTIEPPGRTVKIRARTLEHSISSVS